MMRKAENKALVAETGPENIRNRNKYVPENRPEKNPIRPRE